MATDPIDYTFLPLVKAQLGITATQDDDLITAAISAASRAIDAWTGTTFYSVTEPRTFMAPTSGELWVDRFTDPTGLLVQTGTGGTYTTTVAASSYALWPLNAPSRGLAYDRITFMVGPFMGAWAYPTVQITAAWGFDRVPADVEMATRIMAAALFRRKDSPEGFAGSNEFGVVRISRYTDPDVSRLLAPYTDLGFA